MNKSIRAWQMAGFVFTSVMGTFLHFLFEISGENIIAALFSAVNESIWEHMKLLYYPMLAFALTEWYFWGRREKGFWWVKLMGMLLGLGLSPVIYYTYTGILGTSADWFNIAIFVLAAGAAFRLETWLFEKGKPLPGRDRAAFGLLLLIGAVFTLLTFWPPRIPFFRDPVTGSYGFSG